MDRLPELRAAQKRLEAKFKKGETTAENRKLYGEIVASIADLELGLPNKARSVDRGDGSLSNRSDGPFGSFGEQLVSVMRSAIPGGQTDQRLYAAATGLNETVPSDGGFLVQQDFSDSLLQSIFETGVLAEKCNRIQISGNANSIKLPAPAEDSRATGSRWGGVESFWVSEADEKIKSKPKFRNMELNLKKLVGLCYVTDEVLADSAVLGKIIEQSFSDEFGFMTDEAIINGNGAGQPLGILNSGCLVTQDKEVGQAANSVVFENVLNMFSRMPSRNRKNAAWYISQSVEPQLYSMSLAVGTGGHGIFLPGGSASPTPFSSLFGRPVIPLEQCSVLGDLGDVIFADFGAYILAEKGGIQADMSIHVQFIHDESVFRFVLRVDGQPSLASAIVPFKGSDSLSPFVTLQART